MHSITIHAESAPLCTAVIMAEDGELIAPDKIEEILLTVSRKTASESDTWEPVSGFDSIQVNLDDVIHSDSPNFRAKCSKVIDDIEISPFPPEYRGVVCKIVFKIYWKDDRGIVRVPAIYSKEVMVV